MVAARWLGGEPFLEGLVEAFDFAAGLGVVGPGVVEADAAVRRSGDLEGDAAVAAVWPVKMAPLSVSTRPGMPQCGEGRRKVSTTSGPVLTRSGVAGDGQPGVVVDDVEDLDVGAVGEVPVGDVGLPAFVGQVGFEAVQDDRGRLCGCGVTNPRRVRIRQIVETAGTLVIAGVAGEVGGDGLGAGVEALLGSFCGAARSVLDLGPTARGLRAGAERG